MKLGIRARLLLLALGVALPLAAASLVALRAIWAASEHELHESLERQAELAAVAFERWIDGHVRELSAIAVHLRQSPDLAVTTNVPALTATRQHWIDVRIVDPGGAVLMRHPSDASDLTRVVTAALTTDMRRRGTWAVAAESTDSAPPRAMALAWPLQNGGAVIVRLDASGVTLAFRGVKLREQSVLAAFDAQGRLLYHSRLSVDEAVRDSAVVLGAVRTRRTAVVEAESAADNVHRVYALARAGETDCIAMIGVPSAALYQPARERFRQYLLFSMLAVVCAAAAAVIVARRIARPILRLREVAARFGAGDFRARAPVAGGGEIADLAVGFNRMADLLEQRETNLSEVDRLKSEFVSNVSHELRTPLTTIKTLTRVLLRGQQSEEERREYLQTISVECDRQIDLVVNLLDLARIEAGRFQLVGHPTDAAAVIRDCMTTMGTAAEEKQQRLAIDVPPQLPPVLADRTVLRRVVCGVLDNAIKYTPDGGRITVSTRYAANELGIAISDSGPGIDPDDLPRVFDKFYRGRPHLPRETTPQTAERVDVPGIGLGLYLARTMVDQLGGRLKVETERGRGSTFTIWLPIALGANQQGDARREE